MKKGKLTHKVVILVIFALLAVITLTVVSSETKRAGDAAAGVEYMKNNCMMCHGVPDPSTIKPFDEESGRAFLADHMIKSSEEDLDNMIAYFYPAEEETPKAVKTVKGDTIKGAQYMTNNCMMCHCVPDPSTIKPFNEETGRTFLADHMIKSSEEDLDNMIAYFFPEE